jgi:KDO2-lipid IV(A) lauroyltransferase
MKKKLKIITKIKFKFSLFFLKSLFCFARILGFRASSKFFGIIGRFVGKFTKPNKIAYENIRMAMPKTSSKDVKKIVSGVWNNLGRIIGEFANVEYLRKGNLDKYIKLSPESKKNLSDMKKNKVGKIIFSAHYGNWEMGLQVFKANGLKVKTVYRRLNNIYIDELINDMRGVQMIPKGKKGARSIIRELRNGTNVVILVDQKMNDGIEVPFFGLPAMTAPAIARLALAMNVPVIPVRVIRKGDSCEFEFEIAEEMKIKKTKNKHKDELKIMTKINETIEKWIRQYPEQWFWVHNRWK